MDKKTETLLDRVAEEWAIARKKLGDHCPEIKENDVEMIQAIKTVVTEANVWYRFIRKKEFKHDNYNTKGKPTPKMIGWLKHRNVEDPEKMSFDEASKKIGELRKLENEKDGSVETGESAWF